MADEKNVSTKLQEAKKPEEKKPTAFKGVDTLFDDAAPKMDAAAKSAPGEKTGDELSLVSTQALHAFPDHPYTVDVTDNDMAELVDSIQREGLLERIVVQRRKEGGFEILSGHRRHRACEILGISEVPVIIKNGLSKDQAILLMVDANLKRKNILPMDEAKALRMQLDAMDRMGQRPTHGKVKRTDEAIAEKIGKNRMYVQRKVKLLDLTPGLQEAINDKTLSETPAFEIAFLPAEVQELVLDWMTYEDRAPTVAQAISIRQHQQELTKITKGKGDDSLLDEDQVALIMEGERLEEIFPPEPEPEKDEAEKEAPVGAAQQAPGDGAAKEDGPAAPGGADATPVPVAVQGEPGGAQPVPGAAADAKAIPFQTAATPAPGGAAAPAPAAPAQAAPQAQAQQTAADAQKNYIRTEYMAEIRKENVLLPKKEIEGLVPPCDTNSEYVAAIRAMLEKGQEKQPDAKTAEAKPAPAKPAQDGKSPFPPVTPAPKAPEPPRVDSTPAGPVKPAEPPQAGKVDTPATGAAPAPKAPEPPKVATTPAGPAKPAEPPQAGKVDTPATGVPSAPKPTEPPKVGTAPASPAKPAETPQAGKVDTPATGAAPAPKPTEPPKVGTAPASPVKPEEPPKAGIAPTAPPKAEPPQQNTGTQALDKFLANKPRPAMGKGPKDKAKDKPR